MAGQSKGKKIKLPPTPRSIEELTRIHGNLCAQAGELQYRIQVHTEELANINKALRSVNEEARARSEMDKATPKTAPVETPVEETPNAEG